MVHPYPAPDINSTFAVFEYAQTVTNDLFAQTFMMVALVGIIILVKAKGYMLSTAMLIATVATLVLSSFLWVMGLVSQKFMVLMLIFMVLAGMYEMLTR